MRDKDTIILESLYGLVVEKAKDVIENLKKLNVEDENINKFIAIDPTGQKSDAYVLGKMHSNQGTNADYLISLYKQFLKFKNKKNSQTQDFPRQFNSVEKLEVTIRDLNTIEVMKMVTDKDEAKRLLELDKEEPKIEAVTVAKWIYDGRRNLLPSDVVDAYEKLLELRGRDVEGSKDVTKFNGYIPLTEFIHTHMGNEDEPNKKIDTGGKVTITKKPIYNDDDIAIWYISTVQEAISIGNALIDLADVRTPTGLTPVNWCTTWNLAGDPRGANMFSYYRSNYKWAFYYTWSKKRERGFKEGSSPNDKFVITAIAAAQNGNYTITPAPNGTSPEKSWSNIVSDMPELNGKQKYFEYKTISGEEENKTLKFERMARNFDEEQFLALRQTDQYEYISAGFDIPVKTFPKLSTERKEEYINVLARDLDRELPEKFEAVLSEKEMQLYLTLHERAWENHLQGRPAVL